MLRFLFPLGIVVAGSHPAVSAQDPAADSSAVAAVVQAYHDALRRGDSAGVLRLLTEDALILEAGTVETRSHYRAHHLTGDIEFAQAVLTRRGAIRVTSEGSVAWAISSSQSRGSFRNQPINSIGAELMVLSRLSHGWRIRAIHWSSRNQDTGP